MRRRLHGAARPRENPKGLLTVYNLNWRGGWSFFTFHSVNRAPHVVASIRKEDNKKGGLIHRTDFLMHKNKWTRTMERGVDPCHNHKGLLRVHNPGGRGMWMLCPGNRHLKWQSFSERDEKENGREIHRIDLLIVLSNLAPAAIFVPLKGTPTWRLHTKPHNFG